MTTTDIVPAANIAALDTLDTEARELAITGMLDNARAWLAHAVESTAPAQDISEFKAYIATAAETARRLKVSREIQDDAALMVRRTERVQGQAIRAGQQRGEIADSSSGSREGALRREARKRGEQVDPDRTNLVRAADYFNSANERVDIYEMTDGVTDEQFEEALERAQEEGNVSRRNVVRKVKDVKSGAERQADKWEHIASLAIDGYTSRQVAQMVGMSRDGLLSGAKREGITFPADRVVGATRHIDTNRVIRESTAQLEGVVMALDLINPDEIDPEFAQEWSDSLTQSIKALRKANNQIKESLS